jgi:hypothetical protein
MPTLLLEVSKTVTYLQELEVSQEVFNDLKALPEYKRSPVALEMFDEQQATLSDVELSLETFDLVE